jgi:hypothetical protein
LDGRRSIKPENNVSNQIKSNQISRRSDRIPQTTFLPFLSDNRDLLKKAGTATDGPTGTA